MAAKDPFSASKGEYIGDERAATKLEALLPPGYDLYVLGTQEKVSKHLHKAVLARLHSAERSGRRFVCLQRSREASKKHARRWSRRNKSRSDDAEDDNNAASTRSTRAPSDASNDSSLDHSQSLHLHSFALEASSSIPVLSSKASDDGSPCRPMAKPSSSSTSSKARHSLFARRAASDDAVFATEVSGRGDGAFLSPKSTSLSLYCATDLVGLVEIVRSGTHKFSFASGSKGGVAVMLRVMGHSLTFLNCHLDANRPSVRRDQLSDLCSNLAAAMGLGARRHITTSSDHVIWMGDFNYRIHTLDGASVLKQIAMGRHLEVHDRYDSMRDDLAMLPGLHLFQEPVKWPTFFPTYKKIPGRPPRVEPNGTTDPAWPTRVYRVAFREPFYKGGKVKARVPGWCDRILFSSMAGRDSELCVEQVECPSDQFLRRSQLDELEASLRRDNYRAVNDEFCESDHSPVFCTFRWRIPVAT
ncbi:hypothetical protein ATCC90586_007998 [Pythium insidiosum]|nr:hypothetical protein ATCC90586_007998 [Pythium insidiosum]